jgi:Fe-S cluster assembly ATPase SufC
MLSIRDLHARIGEREVLRGIDLDVPVGEVHAIMGPNGSGKSSLSYVLAGKPGRGYFRQRNVGRIFSRCPPRSAPAKACFWVSSTRSRFPA